MNLFKYNFVELYSKAESGSVGRGSKLLPDPLTSPAEEINSMVATLNDKDKEKVYYLGKIKLSGGTEDEKDMDVLMYAYDHFYKRFLHQRKKIGGREIELKPDEIDAKFKGDRSLENIRDRNLLKKLLTNTAQKLVNFHKNGENMDFTVFSKGALQGMGCFMSVEGDKVELVFSTFLPHGADKPTDKFKSTFVLIDDPMKP